MVGPPASLHLARHVLNARAATRALRAPDAVLLTSTQAAVRNIVRDIDAARSTVDAEFFALLPDGPGAPLIEALARAARRGVRVRLMMSGFGNLLLGIGASRTLDVGASVRMIRTLEAAGVQVTRQWPWASVSTARPVDHRKSVAIDGRVSYIGGMNFGKATVDWLDTMARITGAPGRVAAMEQDERIHVASGTGTRSGIVPVNSPVGAYTILANDPAHRSFGITDWYLDHINNARRRIIVATPALLDRELVAALRAAAARGIDVRVIMPGQSLGGIPMLHLLNRTVATSVADAGAAVLELQGFTHTKAMVVDDEATVGSFNITNRSTTHDQELNVASTDPAFVRQVEQMLARLAAQSRPSAGPGWGIKAAARAWRALGLEY